MSRHITAEEREIILGSGFEFVPNEAEEAEEAKKVEKVSMVDVTHSIDAYFTLGDIVSLVGKIITSKGVLCTSGGLFGDQIYRGKVFLQHSPLSRSLVTCLKKIHDLTFFNDHFELHPYAKLLIDIKNNQSLMKDMNILEIVGPNFVERKVNAINNIIEHIRTVGKSSEFSKVVQEYQRGAKKNYQSGKRYISGLFLKYAKLLVVRIDLSYKQGMSIDIDTAIRHREKFFTLARTNPIFKEMVGYIWKLEYGLAKGYHYHVILIFDGSKVRADVSYAMRVGQFWIDDITDKKGLYYNCNAVKMKYQTCGIGLISYRDKEKLNGLDAALKYMTFRDKFIKVKTGRVRRSFGKGCVIGPSPTLRGRPRIGN